MEISKYDLNNLKRYYELKEAKQDVLAGILRTSELQHINLQQFEQDLKENKITIKKHEFSLLGEHRPF